MGWPGGLSFASPALALAAAAAVALPVLIHLLLRRRRVPVEWAAMELLREAIRRVERRRRLERLLLLALRCALVAAAGLAIAAPFVGQASASSRQGRTLVVLVDDSAASSERLAEGSAFDRSVAAARSAVEGLREGDRVAIVPMSGASGSSRDAASLDRAGALRRLGSLAPTELPCDLPGAVAAAGSILSQPESAGHVREAFLASAFRSGSVGAMAPIPTLGAGIRLSAELPPPVVGANLRVASVEPERLAGTAPGSSASIVAVVQRDRGDEAVRTSIRAQGPSLTAPVERTIEVPAGAREVSVVLPLVERANEARTAGRRALTVTLGGDAQPMDDARGLVLAGEGRSRAVMVDRRTFDAGTGIDRLPPGDWVARALAPSDPPAVDVSFVDPAAFDARTAAAADAVVVAQPQQLNEAQWAVLGAFVSRGGFAAFMPVAKERAQAWTPSFARAFGIPWTFALEATELAPPVALSEDQASASLLAAVSGELQQLAPSVDVFRILRIDVGTDRGATQVSLRDGTPFLLSWRPAGARGTVCMLASAVDLSWTTLPLKPLMVPLWQELVAEARRRSASAEQVAVGSVPTVDRAGVVELRPVGSDGTVPDGARTVSVGAGGRAGSAIDRAGLYQMVDSSGAVQGVLSASVDMASASVAPVEPDRLRGWLSAAGDFAWVGGDDAASSPSAAGPGGGTVSIDGPSLAPWFLAAALVLAATEAILSRRFSHAVRPARAPTGALR